MFDFLKPEVGGMKNVLNAYFKYKSNQNISGDIPRDQMMQFAQWYYGVRLAPPLVSAARGTTMRAVAITTMIEICNPIPQNPITLFAILIGLLVAEGQMTREPNFDLIAKVFDKFPPISPETRGI
jgi:hypothetical protein